MKKLILILILLSIPIFSQNKLLYTNAGKALIKDSLDVVRAEFKAVDDSLAEDIATNMVSLAYPDERTIRLNDANSILLDNTTLKLNASNQLTVIGGVGGGSGGLFETDGNGDLMPNDAEVTDTYYELDGNGDIQPL